MDVNKKKGCDWILVSHDPVNPEEAWQHLQDALLNERPEIELEPEMVETKPEVAEIYEPTPELRPFGIATLKFEPFILHVQCRDLESAKLLHTQR
jgi:tRNA(Phe) wybutosine-synthesizing methylase Tyw3